MTGDTLSHLFDRSHRLPVIQSTEAAECGLACLAMIARFHGHDVDLGGMRQRFPLSMTGVTLRRLMAFAESISLGPRAVKVEMDALGSLCLPAILHWDLDHFVVLKQVRRNRITIHDPASGARTLTLGDASRHFTGVALELRPTATFDKVEARTPISIRSLWSRLTGFWPAFFQVLALSAALQIVAFAMPFQLQIVIDEAIMRSDQELLSVIAVSFGALVIIQATIEGLRNWSVQLFGFEISFQITGNIVRHLTRLPTSFFERRHVGDILSRMRSSQAIQDIVSKGLVVSIIDGLMAVAAIIIMALYSIPMTLVAVGAVILNLVISSIFFPAVRSKMQEQLIEGAREQSHLMETIRAATTLKIMGREVERVAAWRNLLAGAMSSALGVGRLATIQGFLQNLVTGLQIVIVIYLGARTIISGAGFSVGMLIAFLSFRQTFTDRANSLIGQIMQIRAIGLHLERLSDIVASEAEEDSTRPIHFENVGTIELVDVHFRYGSADSPVIKGLDLSIGEGEFVAISGVSGSGKTTLLKIILGLQPPTAGNVRIGGAEASAPIFRAWRENVGVVSQEDQLLSGSVADNIAFFDPDQDLAQVQLAAKAACVHEEIIRMPMQYHTLVGDMGSSLSGGQRQRVLLARALYRNPKILILDEGTANIDLVAEEMIANLVANLPITRLVVAHRPALLDRAQRHYRMEEGRLFQVSS